ncbi:hypothetical protein ACFC1R_35470 [Kitasatospora sp. NPDC056138]|uniref:hypothetical protein n=1 Tax=Kitasatospora sp. NPDC056138 TaxID=3345724 RepID=UPI0035D77DF1
MSNIVEFFIATDSRSANSVLDCGPEHALESMVCENLTVEDVRDWECLLSGEDTDDPFVDDNDHRNVVFGMPQSLHLALRYAMPSRLAEVAELWVQERAEEGDHFEAGPIAEILGGLAALARSAAGRGQWVYYRLV